MQLKSSESSWGLVSITLHWLVAITVFGLFALGLWMTSLNYYHPWYQLAPMIHKSVGIILFGLLLLRLLWRLTGRPPAPLPSHAAWERGLAHAVHLVLYLLLFAIMVSGYLISTADGRAIAVFNWFEIPAFTLGIEQQEEFAGAVHYALALAMIAIVGVHAAGAIKHHLLDRDETLKRMIRWK